MSLLSDQAYGFLKVAELGSITAASRILGLTQPSLSRRIQLLEAQLECKLIQRQSQGVRLTEEGIELLATLRQMCLVQESLFGQRSSTEELSGRISLAGLSSQLNSIFIPLLAPFLRKNPLVQIEFLTREASLLPEMLSRFHADFVVLDRVVERQGILNKVLGCEEFVAVKNRKFATRLDTFLDTDPHDEITDKFFGIQGSAKPKSYKKSFVHDTEGILAGVLNGLGCAVLERRLIPKNAGLEILSQYRSLKIPVVLHYREQAFYTRLQKAIIAELLKAKKLFQQF